MDEKIQELTDLLSETGKAHHRAFIEADGFDPDWPLWYADYLFDRLTKLLEVKITRIELADLLQHLSEIQPVEAPSASWPVYYAQHIAEHYL